jgi:hypothetical protein
MSEQAQESRHKEFKKFRLEHARKISRVKTNEDILHNLLISSDSLIMSLKIEENSRPPTINPSVLKLIKAPNIQISEEQIHESDSDSFCDDSDGSSSGNSM